MDWDVLKFCNVFQVATDNQNSDNGSNFISREVQNYASIKGIKWNFNLPKTPWAGGIFERLIKSVKSCLRKLLNV